MVQLHQRKQPGPARHLRLHIHGHGEDGAPGGNGIATHARADDPRRRLRHPPFRRAANSSPAGTHPLGRDPPGGRPIHRLPGTGQFPAHAHRCPDPFGNHNTRHPRGIRRFLLLFRVSRHNRRGSSRRAHRTHPRPPGNGQLQAPRADKLSATRQAPRGPAVYGQPQQRTNPGPIQDSRHGTSPAPGGLEPMGDAGVPPDQAHDFRRRDLPVLPQANGALPGVLRLAGHHSPGRSRDAHWNAGHVSA